jgi:hypothetical protein
MKHAALIVLLFALGLVACSNTPATPSVGDIQTAIAQTQAYSFIPTIEPTNTPAPARPTKTPVPALRATSTPIQESTNIATVIADEGPHFDFAEISGVAHMENGYFLITLEVSGGVQGAYYARLGEEEFDCVVLRDYPNRLYCTGITTQAGAFVMLQIFELGSARPVYEEEFGIPPLSSSASIQARIKRDEHERPDENPPADSNPYPYPYP